MLPKRKRNDSNSKVEEQKIELFAHQDEACAIMLDKENYKLEVNLYGPRSGKLALMAQTVEKPLFHVLRLPTGSGKTFVALEYARRKINAATDSRFLFLIPYVLFGQWISELGKFYEQKFIRRNCRFVWNMAQLKRPLDGRQRIFFLNMNLLNAEHKRDAENFIERLYPLEAIIADEEFPHALQCSPTQIRTTRDFYYSWLDNDNLKNIWLLSAHRYISMCLSSALVRKNWLDNFDCTVNNVPSNTSFQCTRHVVFYRTIMDDYNSSILPGLEQRNVFKTLLDDLVRQRQEMSDLGVNDKNKYDEIASKINKMETCRVDELSSCCVCTDRLDYDTDSSPKSPIFTECCEKSCICNSCARFFVSKQLRNCPLCRDHRFLENLIKFARDWPPPGQERVLTLLPQLSKVLGSIQGKTVIACLRTDRGYDSDLIETVKQCGKTKITPLMLKGNVFYIDTVLRQFKNSPDDQFLLIDTYYCQYGLNLEFCKNLVVLSNLQKLPQLIGRIMRPGRTEDAEVFEFKRLPVFRD